MNIIGIDIGTTTIAAVVVDCDTGNVIYSITKDNNTKITNKREDEKLQDAEKIFKIVIDILSEIVDAVDSVGGIGISTQMHGMVYLDRQGMAVSPLFTWQDARCNRVYYEKKSYIQCINERIKTSPVASGFGGATHYWHTVNHQIPKDAVVFCTIGDYIAMKLTGTTTPLMHVSNAASFGMFSLEEGAYDLIGIHALEMDASFFPKTTASFDQVGRTPLGVPVCVAIGDNQASFIGSVKDIENGILINIGTGSQISFVQKNGVKSPALEKRPLYDNSLLSVGASLCGGRAYAVLKDFYESFLAYCGITTISVYEIMQKLAENGSNQLSVSTLLCGTRTNPEIRGSISNLCVDNFTPENLTYGFLKSVVDELYHMYKNNEEDSTPPFLVASGNGIRKNHMMQKLVSDVFGGKLNIPLHQEEAAYGACISAMVAIGRYVSITDAQEIIKYIGEN